MVKVRLPFEDLFICEICGSCSVSAENIEKCEREPKKGIPDVRIGDKVLLFGNEWRGNRYVGLSPTPREWRVHRIYYAPSRLMVGKNKWRDLHELCIALRRSIVHGAEQCWEPGDNGIPFERHESYDEFCLWREGDREKLEEAKLVEPENFTKRHSWWKFWGKKQAE